MPETKWVYAGDGCTVADELAFDAMPEESRLIAERVIRHRLAEDRDPLVHDELEEENGELEDENAELRAALEKIADGTVRPEDVETFAKGALAA